jgi:hypothetical protein
MPAAFFVVRVTVADPSRRKAFDEWYHSEHLPDAAKAFGVKKAWRSWSVSDPAVHVASYQFADQAALDRAMGGEAMKTLVADFDRSWPEVTRTREIAGTHKHRRQCCAWWGGDLFSFRSSRSMGPAFAGTTRGCITP